MTNEKPEVLNKNWDVQVRVQNKTRNNNPFPAIRSRDATARILGFYDRKSGVITLLQTLSHTSRAYCLKQAGEKGSAFEAFIRKSSKFEIHVSLEAMKQFDKVLENRFNGRSIQAEKLMADALGRIGTYRGEVDADGNAEGFGIWK